jgi:hypothetical protein
VEKRGWLKWARAFVGAFEYKWRGHEPYALSHFASSLFGLNSPIQNTGKIERIIKKICIQYTRIQQIGGKLGGVTRNNDSRT